jgi:hypothetical protein
MTGPTWVAAGFAVLMLLVAAYCAGRLAMWRLRGRHTEVDADGLHVVMGVAMAGMLEPRLSPVPGTVWVTVFAAAAVWFAWHAIRARSRARPGGSRCVHPAPHAVECAAMLYMLLPAGPAGHGPAAGMPGMSGMGGALTGNPALALVLALFMAGYILWTTDRLADMSRATAAAAARGTARDQPPVGTGRPAAASGRLTRGQADTAYCVPVGMPALAPRLAACYKIAMSIAMGYMLVMMI